MTARRFSLITAFAIVCSFAATAFVRAEEAIPDVANGNRSVICKVNANAVYVRSGPGDNYYPTTKLDANSEVTVVGEKFEWLKIAPPGGSFSYIAKAFVDKTSDTAGTVNRDEVNVRTGSSLNTMKTSIQAQLDKGQAVEIVGEKDEYYQIKPPAGAYVYINKQFVTPLRYADAAPAPTPGAAPQPTDPSAGGQPVAAGPDQPAAGGLPVPADPSAGVPTTAPAVVAAQPAATQPSAEVAFDRLEAEFADVSRKTIEEQPVQELLARYQKLQADPALPESMKRVTDFRVRTLTARAEARDQFVAVQKLQDESKKRQQTLKAEQEELAEQVKKNEVAMYAAVGTLRTSSFQNSGQTLYRLTDPQTGRTVVYIRTNDPKYAPLIGQFVGVKGDIQTEAALSMKVVAPTAVDAVEQANVFKSISAQIVPPSLLPGTAQQASTGN